MWPTQVDMTKEDCRRVLRSLELEAYSSMVSVLRAQGAFGPEKRKLLQEIQSALNIPLERHKAEIRKAVNDEKLNTIAEMLFGPHTIIEWAIEGRRLVPLLPREPPRTVYSMVADAAANVLVSENSNLPAPSETANQATEYPLMPEPSSPESTKTNDRSVSPTGGVLVLPSGTAIQMKREQDEEMVMSERKRRRSSVTQEVLQQQPTLMSPSGSNKVIIVSSSVSPGTSSILQKTLSVPIKSVTPASGAKASVVYTQSVAGTMTSLTEQKIRNKPIMATSIPKPRPSAIVMSNQSAALSPQTIQLKSNKPGGGQLSTPIVTHLKSALQTTKHTVPIQAIPAVQVKGQTLERQPQKILLQQKPIPRSMPKAVQGGKLSPATQKVIHPGAKTPPVGVVMQKPGKGGVMTNVQLKTPQGFTSVPIQLRTGAKSQGLQLKHDSSGNMKMLSITGGAKILPKPTQPVYMVASSSSGLSMVTRTIPASSSPRVMTVSTGTPVKTSQGGILTPNKPVQTVHLMQTPGTPARRQNLVLLQQKPGASLAKASPVTQGSKELVGKMVMAKSSPALTSLAIHKPSAAVTSSALAQSLQNLPVTQTQTGNVILLDLSSQESMTKNAAIAELLQASGLLGDQPLTAEKQKRIAEEVVQEAAVVEEEAQLLEADTEPEEEEKVEEKVEGEVVVKEDTGSAMPTLSIEEAVEMLNRSDTPETRAILSQAGIQISDEIGDSEEEEVQDISQGPTQEPTITLQPTETKAPKKEEPVEEKPVLSKAAIVTTAMPVSTIASRASCIDIFSTAIASADINLDNFMEEEDEPDEMLGDVSRSPKTDDSSQQSQEQQAELESSSEAAPGEAES